MNNQQYAATPIQQDNNPSKFRSAASGATGFMAGILGYNVGEHIINKGLNRLGSKHRLSKFMNGGYRFLTPKHIAGSLVGLGAASAATGIANKLYNKHKERVISQARNKIV